MEREEQNTTASIISLPTLLTVAFVVLKLCKVIDWSWWWVISPTLFSVGIYIILFIAVVIIRVVQIKNDRTWK